jgi:hypothetical protein
MCRYAIELEMYVCIHACIYIYIYIYATYTHTYIHMHTTAIGAPCQGRRTIDHSSAHDSDVQSTENDNSAVVNSETSTKNFQYPVERHVHNHNHGGLESRKSGEFMRKSDKKVIKNYHEGANDRDKKQTWRAGEHEQRQSDGAYHARKHEQTWRAPSKTNVRSQGSLPASTTQTKDLESSNVAQYKHTPGERERNSRSQESMSKAHVFDEDYYEEQEELKSRQRRVHEIAKTRQVVSTMKQTKAALMDTRASNSTSPLEGMQRRDSALKTTAPDVVLTTKMGRIWYDEGYPDFTNR